ncbi:EAL domain-containing protein [Vibrio panuliri]|uniref:cyclic-guanylate-specific phosphodiesterase n=1 Tax=Vibrio panuliri TaxID=1381081 RepID=A0ABX3FR66_9VIBR|nr:EAL domain-containing protein [Vibrio panuliri]KAB1457699.1 EAL domain-containing protein [Vibrio panuliri]OLQ95694.1 diguanylate cyclase [Vibrio panuliri]
MVSTKLNLKTITGLGKSIFNYLPNLLPVAAIFLLAFMFSVLDNYYQTQRAVERDGVDIVNSLDGYIDKVASELYLLNGKLTNRCSTQDKLTLRAHAFHSEFLKEVGMFQDGQVFCTSNEGPSQIALSEGVPNRIAKSENHITISIGESDSHIYTFFIYASIDDNFGLNALLPPERLTDLIAPFLDAREYQYTLTILDYEQSNTYQNDVPYDERFAFSSKLYPFKIELHPTLGTYRYHYLANLWQAILFASACSLLYLIIGYHLLAKRSIEHTLLNAISNDEIELYLQPIVDLNNNVVVGSEALVRWNHPTQGHISPEIFIPLAEKLGVIDTLTEKMLSMVVRFLEQNPHYQETKYVSVNVSRVSLVNKHFLNHLRKFAKRYPKLIDSILLEVTENIDFDQQQLTIALDNLNQIQALGFKLAIDDFGTGYSGLNFIRLHPFQVMKIDQVFIKSLHSESSITPVLVSMIQLAKELNMKVIAEGVETEQQIELLRKLGVSYIQGYYYSYPVKPEALLKLSESNRYAQTANLTA